MAGAGERGERVAVAALAAASVAAAALILFLGRDLTFFSDELGWLTFTDSFALEGLLTPHNGHLIALPRLVYESLPRLFGPEYLPFRVVALVAFLVCVWLFFLLARRRVGGPLALAPAVVLLFFGSAAVIVLSPLGIPFTFSIAFGLGALLAIERSRRWHLLASTLLVLSLLAHSFGGLIAAGCALYLLLGDRSARRRLWVPVAPLALYAVWWLWAQRFDQGPASISNLGEVPAFVVESAVATVAALTGVAGQTLGGRLGGAEGFLDAALVLVAAAGLLVVTWRARGKPAGRWLWAYLLILLGFWVALGLSETPGREPTTPRYLFFGSIMLALVVAERARGIRPGRAAVLAVALLAAVSLVLNLSRLRSAADADEQVATEVRTQLGALEVAGTAADPGFVVAAAGPAGSKHIAITAGAYLDFAERIGGLGFAPDEIRMQGAPLRAGADLVLARALGVLAIPVSDAERAREQRCARHEPGPDGVAAVELDPGAAVQLRLAEPGPAESILLGRFAPRATVPVGEVRTDRPAALGLPVDAVEEPWVVEVAAPLEVCARSARDDAASRTPGDS